MSNSRLADSGALEQRIVEMPGSHRWIQDAPVRFEIMKEGLKRGHGGHLKAR